MDHMSNSVVELVNGMEAAPKKKLLKAIQQADSSFHKKDFRAVLYYMNQALLFRPDCTRFQLAKAEALSFLMRQNEAQELANTVLRNEPTNVDAIYIRGLTFYYLDDFAKAFTHFQQALRYAPDDEKAMILYKRAKTLKKKKEEGNTAYSAGKLDAAHEAYTAALLIDPTNACANSKIYFNRALVNTKRNKLNEAIDDCTKAIELDPKYLKAHLKRGKLYTDSQMFEEAVRDYEAVFKMEGTREYKNLMETAKLELKKSQRKDYYKILGLSKNANEDEIKKAYRKRAMIHHPDRHSSATEEEQRAQEKTFKDVGEAYTILSDAKKRSRYDNGLDIEGSGHGGGFDMGDQNIFNFFGQPGAHHQFAGNQFTFQTGGGPGGAQNGFNPFQFF